LEYSGNGKKSNIHAPIINAIRKRKRTPIFFALTSSGNILVSIEANNKIPPTANKVNPIERMLRSSPLKKFIAVSTPVTAINDFQKGVSIPDSKSARIKQAKDK
jgi:hypothetical protein